MTSSNPLRKQIKEAGIDATVKELQHLITTLSATQIKALVERSSAWRKHQKTCAVGRVVSWGIGKAERETGEKTTRFFDELSVRKTLDDVGVTPEEETPEEVTPVAVPSEDLEEAKKRTENTHMHQLYGSTPLMVSCGCGAGVAVEPAALKQEENLQDSETLPASAGYLRQSAGETREQEEEPMPQDAQSAQYNVRQTTTDTPKKRKLYQQ